MCLAAAAGCSQSGESQTEKQNTNEGGWAPQKNIEWVVTSSAGGGSDVYTRVIAEIMKDEGMVDQTIFSFIFSPLLYSIFLWLQAP